MAGDFMHLLMNLDEMPYTYKAYVVGHSKEEIELEAFSQAREFFGEDTEMRIVPYSVKFYKVDHDGGQYHAVIVVLSFPKGGD